MRSVFRVLVFRTLLTTPALRAAGALTCALALAAPASHAEQPAGTGAGLVAPADSLAADVRAISAGATLSGGLALDDQMLSTQRGGRPGMVMVAATPQLARINAVTLWDEIAPPATPQPAPVDARAAQSNVAVFSRQ